MAAATAASLSTPVLNRRPSTTISAKLGGESNGFSVRPHPCNIAASNSVRVNAAAAAANAPVTSRKQELTKDVGVDVLVPLSALGTYYRQSSAADWDMLLAAMAPFFSRETRRRKLDNAQEGMVAVEDTRSALDTATRIQLPAGAPLDLGRAVLDATGVVRQSFPIRSYEIGADGTASVETLLKYLQEISLNHAAMAGLMAGGFGRTTEMSRRGLIWAVAKMQVRVDRYPQWGDAVEVESWVAASGKNGMRRDWIVRDCETGGVVARATSIWVMMHEKTRKLSKILPEVRAEIEPQFVERPCLLSEEDGGRVPKLDAVAAQNVCRGLSPRWGDLDVNQHVNNVKYISWILESVPAPIQEAQELAGITLEYRKECGRDSVLDSFTDVAATPPSNGGSVDCRHLLQLQDGSEVLRCSTHWRPKCLMT